MPVDIYNEHPVIRVSRARLAAYLRGVLRSEGRPRAVVEVSLVDDAHIRELNRAFRRRDEPTDVLSFSLQEGAPVAVGANELGDVVVSLDTAARQAAAMRRLAGSPALADDEQGRDALAGYDLFTEVAFLATHGVLHLLGYDHQTSRDAQAMEAREQELLRVLTAAPVHLLDRTDHAP